MRLRIRAFFLTLAVAVFAATWPSAQGSGPSVRIASPANDSYVSGPTRLVAMIDPPAAARDVTRVVFFADGRQVCAASRQPFECEWDSGDRIAEHQIRAVATRRDGSRLVHTVRTRGLEYAETVDVDVVQVTAVVTHGDGRFVRGLTQKDFKVFEDNKPQPITNFAAENIPLELVVAVDVSSSMRDAISSVKAAAKQFLSSIEPRDQVTVLAFNENIFTFARRATDARARARAIDLMATWGGTALYDVIIRSVDILGRQAGRRSIVLFSDGDDSSSHAPLATAIERTEGSDATIYAIGQGRAVDTPGLQKLMKQIATVSGGQAFFTDNPGQLEAIFKDVLEDLRNQYVISYPAPENARDGAWHAIKLEVAGGYRIRARQGYRLVPRR